MTDPSLTPAEFGDQMVRRTPQTLALGFEYVSAENGLAAVRAPFRDDLVGDPASQVIAGGVITTLLDHTCGLAISLARKAGAAGETDPSQMGSMATLDFRIDYMRPARPRHGVTGHAQCYRLTRSVAFVRGLAFDDDPADPIATVQAAFALNPSGPSFAKATEGGPRPPVLRSSEGSVGG